MQTPGDLLHFAQADVQARIHAACHKQDTREVCVPETFYLRLPSLFLPKKASFPTVGSLEQSLRLDFSVCDPCYQTPSVAAVATPTLVSHIRSVCIDQVCERSSYHVWSYATYLGIMKQNF